MVYKRAYEAKELDAIYSLVQTQNLVVSKELTNFVKLLKTEHLNICFNEELFKSGWTNFILP